MRRRRSEIELRLQLLYWDITDVVRRGQSKREADIVRYSPGHRLVDKASQDASRATKHGIDAAIRLAAETWGINQAEIVDKLTKRLELALERRRARKSCDEQSRIGYTCLVWSLSVLVLIALLVVFVSGHWSSVFANW